MHTERLEIVQSRAEMGLVEQEPRTGRESEVALQKVIRSGLCAG